jgi:hypothetical protein
MNVQQLLARIGEVEEGVLEMRRREDVACSAQGDETSAEEDKDGEDEVVDFFGVVLC